MWLLALPGSLYFLIGFGIICSIVNRCAEKFDFGEIVGGALFWPALIRGFMRTPEDRRTAQYLLVVWITFGWIHYLNHPSVWPILWYGLFSAIWTFLALRAKVKIVIY